LKCSDYRSAIYKLVPDRQLRSSQISEVNDEAEGYKVPLGFVAHAAQGAGIGDDAARDSY